MYSLISQHQVEILIDKVEEMQAEEDKIDEEKINKMIGKSLDLYSADRVGMPDYALESAGKTSLVYVSPECIPGY